MIWSALTRSRLKAELYERETHFRESYADGVQACGEAFGDVLARTAMMIIKPEGLRSGKLSAICDYLRSSDFDILMASDVTFHRLLWRELWRYQLTSATLDRLILSDRHLSAGPGLVLMLRSTIEHDLPATVRLTTGKGSATLAQQRPGTLRYQLGQTNRLLSLLHVADEPADLVRELGLLFDRVARPALYDKLGSGRSTPQDLAPLRAALRIAPRSLSPDEALARVTAATIERRHADPSTADAILADLDRMRAGERVCWQPFDQRITRLAVPAEDWDLIVLGATFIVYDEPGASKTLVSPDPADWLDAPTDDRPRSAQSGARRA